MTSRTSLPCPAGACEELPPTDGSLPVSTPLITMGWMYLGRWSWVRLATSAVFSFPITMAPRIATPATAPTSRLVFVADAAMPERSGGTTASTGSDRDHAGADADPGYGERRGQRQV